MSDNANKDEVSALEWVHDVELSERELCCIGHIVAQWGALEFEIFLQTLKTFGDQTNVLPKEMNNLQFSEILKLWKERVIEKCSGEKMELLKKQHSSIHHYHEYRNALVHGMWDWHPSDPSKIKSVRVRKKEVITNHLTAAELEEFSLALARINFNVRYPGGAEDLVGSMDKKGHIGRMTASMLMGEPLRGGEEFESNSNDQSS